MKIKKQIALILAAALLTAVGGCGNQKAERGKSQSPIW